MDERMIPMLPGRSIDDVLPLKNKAHGLREFIAVNPGGNWIRIGHVRATRAEDAEPDGPPPGAGKLARATHAASLLDRAGHYDRAATILDAALASAEAEPAVDRTRALVLRAALAINMDQRGLARDCLSEVRQLELGDSDRSTLHAELERAAELESML